MNKLRIPIVLFAILFGAQISPAQEVYDATIQEKEILTPLPQKSPRINGPTVYGIRPGKKMTYRIPCQGERPIQFNIQGLPEGLLLDEKNGIITGVAPAERGSYRLVIEATNKYGAISRGFKIVVGDKIALTPPTGWNSWGGHMVTVSDQTMRNAADILVDKGLADVGFQYVGIDDCWMRASQEMYDNRIESTRKKHAGYDYQANGVIGDVRDANGDILPNGKFPDMKAMTDYIHEKGLKAGIYSTPGKLTCQRWAGSYGHERADADTYAKWGFDLLKYDLCTGAKPLEDLKKTVPGFDNRDFWKPMADYLLVQDRDILYNLCQYGMDYPWTWAPSIGIQSWRTGGDLNHNVRDYFDQALRITGELRKYSKPGQWNDPDFMYIHRIKDVQRMNEPSVEIPLNTNQRYQYVTLWSVICAPFFFSCDINEMDEFTVRLLGNADVFNINQDELGYVARVIRNQGDEIIMVKDMSDGTKILAIFNRNVTEAKIIDFKWADMKEAASLSVYDVWRQKDVGIYSEGISIRLSPDGVGLFKLTRTQ